MAELRNQFGTGIITPFQRDAKSDFANASGMDLVKADVEQLVGIEGPTATEPGEVPWDPDRGTRISSLRHRQLYSEMTRALAEQYIRTPVQIYERRIRVGPITTSTSEDGKLTVSMAMAPKAAQIGELESVPIYREK